MPMDYEHTTIEIRIEFVNLDTFILRAPNIASVGKFLREVTDTTTLYEMMNVAHELSIPYKAVYKKRYTYAVVHTLDGCFCETEQEDRERPITKE
jgi:hypothetical protein